MPRLSLTLMPHSVFKQRIGQFETLMFVRTRVKNHSGVGAQTFDFGDIVHAKSATLIKPARVRNHMAPAGSVEVELDPLAANRTLCVEGVRSPPAQQLNEFH